MITEDYVSSEIARLLEERGYRGIMRFTGCLMER